MKKTNFTHLFMLAGLITLSNLFLTQLKAQTQWKELTVYGSSHVVDAISNTLLTKDKAGNIYASLGTGVFKWDGISWTELGTNAGALNADGISSLITDENGNVYAACVFSGRTPRYQVQKWNGSAWSEVGTGTFDLNPNNSISTITIDKQGNIYAAGYFTNGTENAYVAKWNGTFWAELGNDVGAGSLAVTQNITSIATDSSGNVYAISPSLNVEKWDGTQWSIIGATNPLKGNYLAIDKKTNIYVIDLAKTYEWNGSTWNILGTGDNQTLYPKALALDSKDSLYETAGIIPVAKWNGTAWIQIGSGNNNNLSAEALTINNDGNIYTSTDHNANQSIVSDYNYVAKWNGTTWAEAGNINAALNPTEYSSILTTANDKNGNEYAAGDFLDTAGKEYVAKWNGSFWSELGTGANALNANGAINAITTDGAGNIYAAGAFKNGSVRTYVAKWNGITWSELGGGTGGALFANNTISSIAVDASGNVYAAGNFTNTSGKYYVAKWNGTTWAELGTGATALNANGAIYSICLDTKGNVYAAGYFKNTNYDYYIAKWNGSAWSQLGGGGNGNFNYWVYTVTSDSSDNIYAAEAYTKGIAKWNGSAWSVFGNSFIVNLIKTDKSGNVYVVGNFRDDSDRVNVQKWNGTSWSELGYGFGLPNTNRSINSINIDELKGYIYAGGTFKNPQGYNYIAYNSITSGVLPLTLLTFNVAKQGATAQLSWQTTNEVNTSYFDIQRSEDGTHFTTIGKILAKGNSSAKNTYSYSDDVSTIASGKLYYRLKMVDKDGAFSYSSVQYITIDDEPIQITVTPNPAHNYFVINKSASIEMGKATITVRDLQGRTLISQNCSNALQQRVDVSKLTKGMYLVSIITQNKTQTVKLLIE